MKIMGILPQPSRLSTTKSQLQNISTCRATVAQSSWKVKHNEHSISKIISKEVSNLKVVAHYLYSEQSSISHLPELAPALNPEQQHLLVLSYNLHSRTEDTIRREQLRKKRAMDLPPRITCGILRISFGVCAYSIVA